MSFDLSKLGIVQFGAGDFELLGREIVPYPSDRGVRAIMDEFVTKGFFVTERIVEEPEYAVIPLGRFERTEQGKDFYESVQQYIQAYIADRYEHHTELPFEYESPY